MILESYSFRVNSVRFTYSISARGCIILFLTNFLAFVYTENFILWKQIYIETLVSRLYIYIHTDIVKIAYLSYCIQYNVIIILIITMKIMTIIIIILIIITIVLVFVFFIFNFAKFWIYLFTAERHVNQCMQNLYLY